MRINKDTEDTIKYLLGLGDEEEAIKILKGLDLNDKEIQSVIDEAEPITSEEAFEYMNSN